ncbi:class I SAM-dependent methyltransferase [Candidatus Woesearchaeota archaeon]|nr:class I SAM-dependent methyltransferase [Candidatus Woesearchaeota archaeon]
MAVKYESINGSYDSFYRSLLKKGKLPMKDTGKGFWNAADTKTIWQVLEKIGPHGKFIDLGSGDGKVVLLASNFAKKAVGIEWDSELHSIAVNLAAKLGAKNAEFINGDFNSHFISGYDVVFLNPDKPLFRDSVEDKLAGELTGKLVVFGPHFHPNSLKKVDEFFVNDTLIGVYRNHSK